jgi:NAD(P)-dependent dehydrogenase (short-subunit alcohol dehydrogenase family)
VTAEQTDRTVGAVAPDLTSTPLAELISLGGQVAVVTGGARGIGRAVARRLAEAGARVVITDVEGAADAAAELSAAGLAVDGRQLDVTDRAGVDTFVDRLVGETGRLDVWVNNAGIFAPTAPVLDMPDAAWDRVIDVNLNGAFVCARAAARAMAKGQRGVIVNLASVSGYRGRAGLAHYSSSKHAVRGLTRSLAVELGPAGIRVVGIAPTMVVTEGTDAAQRAAGPRLHATDVYQQLPLGRAGVPDDVARVVLFAASGLAALMTGSTIAVDAGQMSM